MTQGLMKYLVPPRTGHQMLCGFVFHRSCNRLCLTHFPLVNPCTVGPTPSVFGSEGPEWGPRISIANKLLGLADLALGPHFENCCLPEETPGSWEGFWIECA